MAERIVSPGVFTQERDLSFLPQGIAQIGAAFVGPTTQGPAFIPTQVQGIDGFVTTFGEPDGTSYMGYTVKNYLQEAGSATVVRVLGLGGYSKNVAVLYATGSTSKKVFAVLHPTINGNDLTFVSSGGNTGSFSVVLSGSTTPTSASGLSPVEGNTSFIANYFGTNPQTNSTYNGYSYAVFPNALSQVGSDVFLTASLVTLNLTNNANAVVTDAEYSNASTPYIQSQTIAGIKHDLFKVHTLTDGTNANQQIKISITGVTPSGSNGNNYGTFTLLVRDFNDTDIATNVLESWDNLTLDPDSPDYIARRIGNAVPTYDVNTGETLYIGDYPILSKYIRVTMNDAVIPQDAVPYGYAALSAVVSGSVSEFATGSLVYSRWVRTDNGVAGWTTASIDRRYYYGFNFNDTTSLSYLGPVAGVGTAITVNGTAFTMESVGADVPSTGNTSRNIALTGSNSRTDVGYRRFTVPFQGGFDGLNPARTIALGSAIVATNSQGFDLSTSTSSGSLAYKRALDSISNQDSVDLNLLVMPGVIQRIHSYVAQEAIDLCETRGDAFYIMDIGTYGDTINTVTAQAQTMDTNYAACYYPWVQILDTNTNKVIWAPPSVVLPEVYQYNDNVGAEWFAPAGLNRGGIPGATGVKSRLSQNDRDILYEANVNPIAQFPGQGICVWGQKTLQRRASALDRVNVRRLLITLKKFIASSARFLVFEQNTEATRQRFLNIVNPYLAGVQQRSGLTSFRVVMDETNNTPDIIDRNILAGAIYLQPTRTAEFIKLDFNILPTGATFDTI
jgi:hypothetical protein